MNHQIDLRFVELPVIVDLGQDDRNIHPWQFFQFGGWPEMYSPACCGLPHFPLWFVADRRNETDEHCSIPVFWSSQPECTAQKVKTLHRVGTLLVTFHAVYDIGLGWGRFKFPIFKPSCKIVTEFICIFQCSAMNYTIIQTYFSKGMFGWFSCIYTSKV